jgi:hypothetical protein
VIIAAKSCPEPNAPLLDGAIVDADAPIKSFAHRASGRRQYSGRIEFAKCFSDQPIKATKKVLEGRDSYLGAFAPLYRAYNWSTDLEACRRRSDFLGHNRKLAAINSIGNQSRIVTRSIPISRPHSARVTTRVLPHYAQQETPKEQMPIAPSRSFKRDWMTRSR